MYKILIVWQSKRGLTDQNSFFNKSLNWLSSRKVMTFNVRRKFRCENIWSGPSILIFYKFEWKSKNDKIRSSGNVIIWTPVSLHPWSRGKNPFKFEEWKFCNHLALTVSFSQIICSVAYQMWKLYCLSIMPTTWL